MSYKGIDLSKHNGTVDFAKVKSAGIEFVMIRAGYGKLTSQKDSKFESNYAGCKAQNIPCGAYWYSYATNVADAQKEAQACLSVIKGKTFEYPIVFDIEDKTQAKLGQATISAITDTFCGAIQSAGYYAMMYTYKAFAGNISDAVKAKYDMWIAQVSNNCTYTGDYGIWQHSFTGSVAGVNGDVDLDISYKDYPSIIKAKGLNGYEKSSSAPTSSNNINYDVNGDGKVSAVDLVMLKNKLSE